MNGGILQVALLGALGYAAYRAYRGQPILPPDLVQIGGTLGDCASCQDQHVSSAIPSIADIWEGPNPLAGVASVSGNLITYRDWLAKYAGVHDYQGPGWNQTVPDRPAQAGAR